MTRVFRTLLLRSIFCQCNTLGPRPRPSRRGPRRQRRHSSTELAALKETIRAGFVAAAPPPPRADASFVGTVGLREPWAYNGRPLSAASGRLEPASSAKKNGTLDTLLL